MSSEPEAGMGSINRSPRWSMCSGGGWGGRRPAAAITDLDQLIPTAACRSQPLGPEPAHTFTADGRER